MSFKEEMVSDFKSSLSFLIDSMMQTYFFYSRNESLASKPSWAVQVEKFSSLYDKIKDNQELVDNLKYKVVAQFYKNNSFSFMNRLVNSDGSIDDGFLKLDKNSDEEDSDTYKLRTTPKGLFLQVSQVFLPLSEVYTEAVKIYVSHRDQNLPFPNKILLGMYSSIYYSTVGDIDDDAVSVLRDNISVLKQSLEVCNEVKPNRTQGGPIDMIKNMLGNVNFDQLGDMMSKVTGDEKSSKEFGEVFGKLSDTIKSGGNPLDAMSDIIKQASVNVSSEEQDDDESEPPKLLEAPSEETGVANASEQE